MSEKHVTEARVRVRYAETDQMGVVYYANYIVWMEVGRVEFCKAVGFNYRDMEQDDGILLTVAEVDCRYLAPARFDDEVIIRTWIEKVGSRMAVFGYEMRRGGDGARLATGTSKHVFCGRDMRPVRLPAKYLEPFGAHASEQ